MSWVCCLQRKTSLSSRHLSKAGKEQLNHWEVRSLRDNVCVGLWFLSDSVCSFLMPVSLKRKITWQSRENWWQHSWQTAFRAPAPWGTSCSLSRHELFKTTLVIFPNVYLIRLLTALRKAIDSYRHTIIPVKQNTFCSLLILYWLFHYFILLNMLEHTKHWIMIKVGTPVIRYSSNISLLK